MPLCLGILEIDRKLDALDARLSPGTTVPLPSSLTIPIPSGARTTGSPASRIHAANPARIVVDHPNYQAETPLTADTRAELLADLS